MPNPAWLNILLLLLGIAGNIVITATVVSYKLGKREEAQRAFKKNTIKDVQELYKALSENNDMSNERYSELEDLVKKLKSAFESYTGRTINGVDYRRH